MATLEKNGYSYTGYTEPFFTPDTITSGDVLAKIGGYDTMSITGAVDISLTEFRNAGLFVRFDTSLTGTTHTSGDINFDTNKGGDIWVIEVDGTQVTVSDVQYDNVNGVYNVELSGSVTVVATKPYMVVGRVVDVGDITASRDYAIGEKVLEQYPA